MRIIKFTINERAYETFSNMCKEEDITIKKKINVLLSKDNTREYSGDDIFPADSNQELRTITLKLNEEVYKGIMKNSDILEMKSKRYIQYLIYKYIKG